MGSAALAVVFLGLVAAWAVSAASAVPVVRPSDPPSMMVNVIARNKTVGRLTVAPPPLIRVRGEAIVIGDEAPDQWRAGTQIPGLMNPTGSVKVGFLASGSVVVWTTPGGSTYQVGSDYLLDEEWAVLGRVATGRIPKGETVYLDYDYHLSRLDTVQLAPDGVPSIRPGKPAGCPLPARAARGQRALANIWLRPGMKALTASDIYPIGPAPSFPTPNRAPTKALRKRFSDGGPLTIVVLGDSVGVGGEASKPERAFPQVFAAKLRKRYPDAQIRLINACVGGTTSDYGLQRLDRDVLSHHPHLVIVEFVNDMGWKAEKIRANYRELISRIRAAGAEPVILTPSLVVRMWMGNFDEALAAIREVAAEEKVGLADGSLRWKALQQLGIPYETLLVNCLNHPDDRGHRMLAQALLGLF